VVGGFEFLFGAGGVQDDSAESNGNQGTIATSGTIDRSDDENGMGLFLG
jgi:hypothetical protein